ncbi:MAG: hypothetical protein A2Z15_02025 [Chloroflexi bacterium RBG_16_50_11]|nr:MAG: hypothetical protein A2Z15_02025 [Chloroflexi bacterium RBG_16_50_11]
METALISIICIALVIFGGMTMSQGFMTSVDASSTGLSEIGQRTETIMRTELTPISTNISLVSGPDPLEIVLENTGQTKIADFDKWDVIVQYWDSSGNYTVKWLPYSASGGGTNVWGVNWIRLDGQAEIFEPDVLNPGEQIMIKTWLDASVGAGTTNMVVVSTPSGVTSSTYFSP